MQLRPELRPGLIAGTALALTIAIGAAALGASRARVSDADHRRSTFLSGPSGALGYAQTLERLGVQVERFRGATAELEPVAVSDSSKRTLVAVLGPAQWLTVREARTLIALPTDLLLAGPGATTALRCLGYTQRPTEQSSGARGSSEPRGTFEQRRASDAQTAGIRVRAALIPERTRMMVDSSSSDDGVPVECTSVAPIAVDTLLPAAIGVGALRLVYDHGRTVTIVADDELFSNRELRTTAAGPFAVGLVVPRYQRVVVDESHQGFGTSGSLAGALFDWSVRSPWGWAAWQLAIVGLLALLASGVRFGPMRSVIDRRRRSPLEHVRALATALAAARGHTVAIGLMVRGLRRRLSHAGPPSRDDSRAWLDGLAEAVRTARGRRALDTLQDLTGRPVDAEDVRLAANAVEDVWEALTTKSPGMPRPPQAS